MRKQVLLFVTLATIGLFLVSCGGSTPPAAAPPAAPPPPAAIAPAPATPPPAAPAAPAIDAAKLYSANCAACHQATRQGLPPTFPALTPASLASKSAADVKTIIAKGKTGTAMTGYDSKLSAAEIDALVNLLKNVAP